MAALVIPNFDKVMSMIVKNIFRPLPSFKRINLDKKETGIELEKVFDPAWVYVQGVYEIFLGILLNEAVSDAMLKPYCTPKFIQEFLSLFES